MKSWRKPWIVAPLSLGMVLGLGGAALAAFSATTTDGANQFVAAADWEPPHVTRTVVAKTPGYLGGKIRQGGQFFVYAQIDDGGNPPAGVGTVTADVSAFSTGGTAVAMAAGAFSVEGVLYNRRSAVRTAINPMAAGIRTYSFTMADVVAPTPNAQTQTGFTVTVDNTIPVPVSWTAVNKVGGIAGRAEQGDIVTYTWNEPIDPESLIAGWNGGSPITVTARISNGGGNARFRLRNAAGVTTLPFGTVYLQRNYVNATTLFPNSTITMLGNTVTVILGAPNVPGNINTVTVATTPTWTPSTAAYDAAGNPMSGTAITLPGGPKIFF
jgi:hypothetical protein